MTQSFDPAMSVMETIETTERSRNMTVADIGMLGAVGAGFGINAWVLTGIHQKVGVEELTWPKIITTSIVAAAGVAVTYMSSRSN